MTPFTKMNSRLAASLAYMLSVCAFVFAFPMDKRDVGDDASQQNSENISKITAHSVILGIILIVVGIIFCFFGRKYYRVTMFFVGLYVGAIVTWVILTNAEPSNGYGKAAATIYLIVSLAIGVLVGIFFMLCADVAVWFLGGLGGYTLALFILSWADGGVIHSKAGRIIFIILFTIAGFLLTFFFKNTVIILSTAFVGAFSIMLGIDMFARTGFKEGVHSFLDGNHDIVFNATTKVYLMLVATIILFLIGAAFQWRYHRGPFGPTRQTTPEPTTTGKRNWRNMFRRRT